MIKPFKLIQLPAFLLIGFLLFPGVKAAVVTESLTWAYILFLSFGLTSFLVPTMMWVAEKIGAVDKPGGRKTHQHVTPLMGGATIFLGFALVMFLAQDILYFTAQRKGVALGATLIFLVGLLDDIWGLTAKIRLLAQVFAVGILIKYGAVLSFLPDTWWGELGEYLITFLWVVGITNAINFLDGMDGLASGTAAINATFFSLVALRAGGSEMLLLSIALAGSVWDFCPSTLDATNPPAYFWVTVAAIFWGLHWLALAFWENGVTMVGWVLWCLLLFWASPFLIPASPPWYALPQARYAVLGNGSILRAETTFTIVSQIWVWATSVLYGSFTSSVRGKDWKPSY